MSTKMDELLNKLVELQEVLKEIYFLEKENRELPVPVRKKRRAFEPRVHALADKEKSIEDLNHRIGQLEQDLAVNADSQKVVEEKLKVIKTQKEYDALATEKDFLVQANEDATLEMNALKEKTVNLENEIVQLREDNAEQEKEIVAAETAVNESIDENDKKIAEIRKKSDKMADGLDPIVLNQFEKIINHKEGVGIVSVVNDTCGGCHMVVPPQLISELYTRTKLIHCLHCSRILYIEE